MDINKIEQLGTGAVLCQLIHSYYNDSLKMNLVNWNAKSEHEFVNNFKLLQKAFKKTNLNKNIDIPKLVKCKY